jgi:hypothetical protein
LEIFQIAKRHRLDVDAEVFNPAARFAFEMTMTLGNQIVAGFGFFDVDDPNQLGFHQRSQRIVDGCFRQGRQLDLKIGKNPIGGGVRVMDR